MADRTLLERMRDAERRLPPSLHDDRDRLLASILGNLQRILNSRVGHAPAQQDYGIPAPCEIAHSFPEGISIMRNVVLANIEKFEPRLTDAKVTHVQNPADVLTLRYSIRARLATVEGTPMVSFDTVVDASGQIRCRH